MALFHVDFFSYFRQDLPSPEVICVATRIPPVFNPEECEVARAWAIWAQKYRDRMKLVGFFDERSHFTNLHGTFNVTHWKQGYTHIKFQFNYKGQDAQRRSGSETNVDGPVLGIKEGTDYLNRAVITSYERHAEFITEEEIEVICQDIFQRNRQLDIAQFMACKAHRPELEEVPVRQLEDLPSPAAAPGAASPALPAFPGSACLPSPPPGGS